VGGRSVTDHVGQQAGRDLRPSQWERTTRDRLIAGDEGALNEIYDQFSSRAVTYASDPGAHCFATNASFSRVT
jgi:hypothetical protein